MAIVAVVFPAKERGQALEYGGALAAGGSAVGRRLAVILSNILTGA